jgi:hypothetical protein
MDTWKDFGNAFYDLAADVPFLIAFEDTSNQYKWKLVLSICRVKKGPSVKNNNNDLLSVPIASQTVNSLILQSSKFLNRALCAKYGVSRGYESTCAVHHIWKYQYSRYPPKLISLRHARIPWLEPADCLTVA